MKAFAILPLLAVTAVFSNIDPELYANIRAELEEPIKADIGNLQPIEGHITKVSENQIEIKSSEGIGEITFVFEKKQIEGFKLPGESYKSLALEWLYSGRSKEAHDLMQLLFEQRKSILPMLPPSESNFFVYYVRLILNSPRPARAIAIADLIRPQIKNPDALRDLDDSILESYYKIALYDEARALAETWIQSSPPHGESALGYYVLATDSLRNENHVHALDLALQPIVFSSSIPVSKLAHCYAAAIGATLKLRDKNHAIILYQEMQERRLDWPEEDDLLKPFHEQILEYTQNP